MNIRTSRSDEVEQLAALFTASIHHLARFEYSTEQREAWAPLPPDLLEWKSRLSALTTLVMEGSGNTLSGFISYEANGHIDLLYTAPHIARRGVASALYVESEKRLTEAGVTVLFTEASLVAAPFFKRQGFEVVEEQRVQRRGISFRRYAMKKDVPLLP